ncbi:MAG: Cysteine desulfuration protein SufE [Gammaproteobacteria bacterium]|nr:Cysteine desulfuration protein SufE [Gammaproteobacteria bacterium]
MTDEVQQAQREIVDEFAIFDDWMGRYEYLIDLGKELPEFPEAWRTDANKIRGCQSQVWFHTELDDGRMKFEGISDAAIVSGLIAVLIRAYGRKYPQDILNSTPGFIGEIGFDEHLSPTRSNGLHAMLAALYGRVQQYADQ